MNICKSCEKQTTNPKFCSRSCAAKYTNKVHPKKKRTKKCIKCENITKSHRHTLCEAHHKEYMETRFDYIKELSLKDYWDKKSLINLHPSSKNAHIRGLARAQHKNLTLLPCARCGYDKHVELCHIKALKDFDETAKVSEVNDSSNIIQLCPNCHWELDNNLWSLLDSN